MRHEVPDQRHCGAAGTGEEERGPILAPDPGAPLAETRTLEDQRPEQEAEHVHMVNHHLHQQHPLQTGQHGLAHQGRKGTVLVGQQAGGHDLEPGRADSSDPAIVDPGPDPPVVWPEPPVLVHHQGDATADFVHEIARLLEGGRQRLLAEDGEPLRGRYPTDVNVVFPWGRDVDHIEAGLSEHPLNRRVDGRDAVPRRPLLGRLAARIGHGDHGGAVLQGLPRVQVVLGDPPGSGQPDADPLAPHGATAATTLGMASLGIQRINSGSSTATARTPSEIR